MNGRDRAVDAVVMGGIALALGFLRLVHFMTVRVGAIAGPQSMVTSGRH